MPAVANKAQRRKTPLVARRRGRKVEVEEDETQGSEESYSDDSGISEATMSDEDTEDDEEDDEDEAVNEAAAGVAKLQVAHGQGKGKRLLERAQTDTELMDSALRDKKKLAEAETVDFEEMGSNGEADEAQETKSEPGTTTVKKKSEATPKRFETPHDKRRREHEEYKKRRQEDPAFVPNRGRFFMHDHRDGNGSNGFRPFAPAGRGRGGRRGDHHHQAPPPPPELASEWKHDMHEQMESQTAPPAPQPAANATPQQPLMNHNTSAGRQKAPDQPRSFGRTFQRGNVQIQVKLPGMENPVTFSEVPSKVYTRLPYHRPPLRRDKPVRIALPGAPVRYIYPSVQRSFIFIPRAMRPGGSRGIGPRGRGGYPSAGRGMYHGGYGAYGGYHGGYGGPPSTAYTPSVGMSRRSSVHYDVPPQMHPAHIPPHYVPDPQTRPAVVADEDPGKPIVRLPSAAGSIPSGPSNPTPQGPTPRNAAPSQPLPPPAFTPTGPYREARATPKIPMHQPRPQKAVNVSELDTPNMLHYPQSYAGSSYAESMPSTTPVMNNNPYAQHSRQPSYQSQASATPLSQIPEAVHARQFHPGGYPPPHPQYYNAYPQAMPPQQQGAYPGAPYAGSPAVYPQHSGPPVPAAGPTTIAQESNGMVYYSTWDPNTYQPSPAPAVGYPQPYPTQDVGGPMYYYPPPGQPQQQGYYQQ